MTKVFFISQPFCNTQENYLKTNFLSEFEPLISMSTATTFTFFKTKSDYYYNLNIATTKQNFNTVLLQQTMLNRLPYLVDAYAITEKTSSIFYIFNCFYSNRFTNLFFQVKQNTYVSITSLHRSAGWVERELKEFSNLYITSLHDSRRLLTDYTSFKKKLTPIFYDLVTQEVF